MDRLTITFLHQMSYPEAAPLRTSNPLSIRTYVLQIQFEEGGIITSFRSNTIRTYLLPQIPRQQRFLFLRPEVNPLRHMVSELV